MERKARRGERPHLSGGNVETFRVTKIAEKIIAREKKFDVDFLDLSKLASEYGRVIYPCKERKF